MSSEREQGPMKSFAASALGCLLLLGIAASTGCAGEQERWSTAKREVPVYSGMSFTSAVIKSLNPGDRVSVEFELSNGTEHWCQVREPGEKKSAGFVACNELDRPPAPPPKWRIEPPAAPEAAP